MTEEEQQRSMKKREVRAFGMALERIKEAVETHVSNLNKSRVKIVKMRKGGNMKGLEAIQIEVSNEVKKLGNILKELERLKENIPQEELGRFCNQMEHLQTRVVDSTESIMSIIELSNADCDPCHEPQSSHPVNIDDDYSDEEAMFEEQKQTFDDNLDLASEVAAKQAKLQAWDSLRRDLSSLNYMFNQLATSVWDQKETIERIDEKVEGADNNITQGAMILQTIKKNTALPFIGAAVGTCIAGPIGLLAGLKLGVLAGIGTGTAGYFGGRAVQRITNDIPPLNMIKNVPESIPAINKADDQDEPETMTQAPTRLHS